MSPSPTVTADLAHDLRLAVMRLARRARQERADHGLPLGQLSALATLDRMGPLTPGALAQHEQVRPPSMSKVLANLHEAGLVERVPDPTDGRSQVVSLTAKARRLLREDRRRRDAWMSQALDRLTPAERAVLRDAAALLDRLAGA